MHYGYIFSTKKKLNIAYSLDQPVNKKQNLHRLVFENYAVWDWLLILLFVVVKLQLVNP